MNPYTPDQWMKREASHAAHLARIAEQFPPIPADDLRESCKRASHLAMIQDGMLADAMRKEPEGKFCGFGGLNPHIAGEGEDAPRCRSCSRNDACNQPFKVAGW